MRVVGFNSLENIFQKSYRDFSQNCLQKTVEAGSVRSQFNNVRNLFVRGNQIDEFCDSTIKLSNQLNESGKTELSTLILNELSKMCVNFKLHDRAEELLFIAIDNSKRNCDGLHELARIIDLERIYKFTGNRKGMFQIRDMKKECCKKIISNYDENLKNFRTIHKKATTLPEVQVQLAFTYSDLASMLERRKPVNSIKLYTKAKVIYEQLGRNKEVAYLEEKIRRIITRNNISSV